MTAIGLFCCNISSVDQSMITMVNNIDSIINLFSLGGSVNAWVVLGFYFTEVRGGIYIFSLFQWFTTSPKGFLFNLSLIFHLNISIYFLINVHNYLGYNTRVDRILTVLYLVFYIQLCVSHKFQHHLLSNWGGK